MPFPKELYSHPFYRVVHSLEEEAVFKSQGWVDSRNHDQQYVVHTAIEHIPSVAEVIAAGYTPDAAASLVAREEQRVERKCGNCGQNGHNARSCTVRL